MTQIAPGSQAVTSSPTTTSKPNYQAWYRPTISHEHGVYVVLLVSFITGAAAAQSWTLATTLALVCAFCGFQAEHPLVLQIKQRKSWKPRFLFWGGVYGSIALAIAIYLYLTGTSGRIPLLLVYLGAVAAFLIDVVSVFHREQKSVANELITFAAVCLCAPLAYVVTTGSISTTAIGLWLLNTLFFASAIFTVKLRKSVKGVEIWSGIAYHALATAIIAGLYLIGWLSPFTAIAFGVVLLKFGVILWQKEWYCTCPIQQVAMLETSSAFAFLTIAALSVLPAHLGA